MPINYAIDTKEYSTVCIQGSTDRMVMAGTMYGFSQKNHNVPNFIRVSDPTSTGSLILDDPNLLDIRVVSLVSDGANAYFMTCLGRPDNVTHMGSDGIRIFHVDSTGDPVDSGVFITTGLPIGNLYPLHSLMHNGLLYICGYMTDAYPNTQLPNTPDFKSFKCSFVLSYDPVSQNVMNTLLLKTIASGASSATNDCDIAMRLVELSNGNIFVTGSVNDVKPEYMNPTNPVFHSATLSLEVDNGLNVIQYNPFCYGSEVSYFGDEYGIGLVENPNSIYQERLIVGNMFTFSSFNSGFNPYPQFLWITGSARH